MPMKLRCIIALCLFGLIAPATDAAVVITIAPDDVGGTTYTFSQTTDNPVVPIALVNPDTFHLDLPPGMFSPILNGGPFHGDIFGNFPKIGEFRDLGSGTAYNVTGLWIARNLSAGTFNFHRTFFQGPEQSTVQMDLVTGAPGELTISPEALVVGIHSISSALFGTVTVNVIPEPACLPLVLLGAVALLHRRNPRAERAVSDS